MKELIYVWIESVSNRANIRKQGMSFSNNYKVSLERLLFPDVITRIHIEKTENLYQGFYGKNILSISALVGINGVGKTTILDILGSTREIRKRNKVAWRFFALYKINEQYVIEGNDLDVIQSFVRDIHPSADDEYSFICDYDENQRKLVFRDFCSASGEIEKSVKYYYFQDRPLDKKGYLLDDYQLDTDYNVCFERLDMQPDAANIYKTYCEFRKDKTFSQSIDLSNLQFAVTPKKKVKMRFRGEVTEQTIKERWIVEMLLAVVETLEGGKKVLEQLHVDLKELFWEYDAQKYGEYVSILLDAIRQNRWWNREDEVVPGRLISLVGSIPGEFFERSKDSRWWFESSLTLSADEEFSPIVYQFLREYPEYVNFSYRNVSAGEKKVLDVFAGVYSNIARTKDRNVRDTMIILLDEPDKGLHPEMSRRFISWLVKVFDSLEDNRVKYQFILSTHSPFLISDIPAPYVHCLKQHVTEKSRYTTIEDSDFGLLNSIPDLMKDTFFMDSPFGEYGNQYFKKLQAEIKELTMKEDKVVIERLKKKIAAVNDEVLHRYLVKAFEEKLGSVGSKRQRIEYYEEKIRELRGENE